MRQNISIIGSLLLLLLTINTYAQGDKINFKAAKLKSESVGGEKFRVFLSTPSQRVKITQGNSTVYCDVARENTKTRFVTATGNVKVVDQKTTITGDKLTYNPKNSEIVITGKEVVLTDEDLKLYTDKLYYYSKNKTAKYLTNGKVFKNTMTLTSKEGYLKEEKLDFKGNVVIDDREKDQHLESEAVTYHRDTEIATFNTETTITSKDGDVVAQAGNYNTKTGEVNFEGEAVVENDDYVIVADYIDSQKDSGDSYAKGNVIFYSKTDSVTIFADEVVHEGKETKAYGNALMARPMQGSFKNLLYMAADTLYSYNDTLTEETTLYAYHGVQVYNQDIKSKCDSLVYFYNDSMIYFYEEPVIWAQGTQMEGRTIKAQITSKGMEKMYLDRDAFVISKDSTNNYNQIKGRKIIANMDGKKIDYIDINGNGEAIYYVMDDRTKKVEGMNVTKCAKMTMDFDDAGELNELKYHARHDSQIVPPEQITKENSRLSGFKIREEEKPKETEVVSKVRKRRGVPSHLPIAFFTKKNN
ncbi:OstA-like protein [Algivirga pacifica]|uniref:OstA-like protein n=1 Tax=Algivirga pacifica TaxID=1162670 RepID=A0ABP9D3F1_9BACT